MSVITHRIRSNRNWRKAINCELIMPRNQQQNPGYNSPPPTFFQQPPAVRLPQYQPFPPPPLVRPPLNFWAPTPQSSTTFTSFAARPPPQQQQFAFSLPPPPPPPLHPYVPPPPRQSSIIMQPQFHPPSRILSFLELAGATNFPRGLPPMTWTLHNHSRCF